MNRHIHVKYFKKLRLKFIIIYMIYVKERKRKRGIFVYIFYKFIHKENLFSR